MAAQTTHNPISLFKHCVNVYVENLNHNVTTMDAIAVLQILPSSVLIDIYVKMTDNKYDTLFNELSSFDVIMRLLRYAPARNKLIKCVSVLMCNQRYISTEISSKFVFHTQHYHIAKHDASDRVTDEEHMGQIDAGLQLGAFLFDCGWLQDSLKVFKTVLDVINLMDWDYKRIIIKFDCLQRLLHAQVAFCCFDDAQKTYLQANEIIRTIGWDKIPSSLLATFYKGLSVLYFARSDYSLSYEWSIKALEIIGPRTAEKVSIDVLRQAAKSCVVKREFNKARILISKAVNMASSYYGESHQKYADCLLDYGFFLLNVDAIVRSVQEYERALEIKRTIFGVRNISVATAEEDLSYALYVREYSSGKFMSAKKHICRSIDILRELLRTDHLLLSSARRVKALILEEIAIDNFFIGENSAEYHKLLLEAEELHQSALQITIDAFGEVNVQTAKHYGNLGRLYQSMSKYQEAEELHKRAIKIKSDLLGPDDYEVGLSIGHLASLYSYHMEKYREAESLYLRSISISLKLFGESYSGLEYDYKGLCNVYLYLDDTDKYLEYSRVLETWRVIREENYEVTTYDEPKEDNSLDEIREKFFQMCKNQTDKPQLAQPQQGSV